MRFESHKLFRILLNEASVYKMKHNTDKDLQKLVDTKEVYLREDLPFEAPNKTIEKGPLFRSVEEVSPELGESPTEDSASSSSSLKSEEYSLQRRDFMKLFSASAVVASTVSCVRRPVEKVVPYVHQPLDQVPGVAVNYATTEPGINSLGLIIKTREGRPVIVEGNSQHPLSQGATSAPIQASIQTLYHPERPKSPRAKMGNNKVFDVKWNEVLEKISSLVKGKKVGIFTGGSTGHRQKFFKDFLKNVGSEETRLYTYESQTLVAATATAYKIAFGVELLPRNSLNKANFVVGFGTEFQDVGIASIYDTKSFSQGQSYRRGTLGQFIQFESRYTNTGTQATERHPIAPGDELGLNLSFVKALLAHKSKKGSKAEISSIEKVVSSQEDYIAAALKRSGLEQSLFDQLADKALKNKSVTLSGQSGGADENATLLQLSCIMSNILLGAYGTIMHIDRGWMKPRTNPMDLQRFLKESSDLDVLFVIDSNPAFTVPESTGIKQILEKIPNVVSIQSFPNETDEYASFMLNGHHFLESWGDEEPVAGFYSTRQPVVRPFTNSKQAEDVLLWVCAHIGKPLPHADYRSYLKTQWKKIHAVLGNNLSLDRFFDVILRTGFVGKLKRQSLSPLKDLSASFAKIKTMEEGYILNAYLDSRLTDGEYAESPLLQETPDGLTSICWDTWVAVSPNTAKAIGAKYNKVIEIKSGSKSLKLAVYPLPGLHDLSVVIPRGNGHSNNISKIFAGIGKDPLPLLNAAFDPLSGVIVTSGQKVELTPTGETYRLCATQKHNDIANRTDIIKFLPLSEMSKNEAKSKDLDTVPDLYPELEVGDYRWGMSVDFGKCNGCSSCSVACSVENNIPSVGREQIMMGRTMTWIRSDRYFSGSVENPKVTFQPVMCQHCNHAPCEPVCPVFATTHDPEGMNAQTYNRCVGTRYCANACPYKVRRFNWFTHKWNIIDDNPIHRNPRALNPDVTVRTRGIMEKCTFCVQRVRDAKHKAKADNRKVREGDIKTACQQACPSDAIIFGDLKDPTSRVAKLRKDYRAFSMLGGDPEHKHYGIKTLPNVTYLAQVTHDGSSSNSGSHDSGGHSDESKDSTGHDHDHDHRHEFNDNEG